MLLSFGLHYVRFVSLHCIYVAHHKKMCCVEYRALRFVIDRCNIATDKKKTNVYLEVKTRLSIPIAPTPKIKKGV